MGAQTTKIISGKEIASDIREELKKEVLELKERHGVTPGLVTILVGNDPPSISYVKAKQRTAHELGFHSVQDNQEESITEDELLSIIDKYNKDDAIHGILVQLPLPKHIDEGKVLNAIDPDKDVDGFHPTNIGKMVLGAPTYLPATPAGIMMLLDEYQIKTAGKNIVVLGRSNIVGTPMSIMLSRKSDTGNATVTLCHSRTENLKEITKKADIIIAAIGKAEFLKADMVKKGVVVIDVGIHRIDDKTKEKGYRITGDVDFDEVSKKASLITPVPGGVGLMTISALLENTLKAAKREVYR